MCLIAIAYRVHPAYPLIIAANRDEFYDRPTAPLDFWPDHPDILAGRDLKNHGTWLGVNTQGKVAAVTNYREPDAKPDTGISRGRLVSDFLAGKTPAENYLDTIAGQKDAYSGFNLIAGKADRLLWYSNRGGVITIIDPGIHAVSNHLLDTPWPKTETIRQGMAAVVGAQGEIDPEEIFSLLADTTRPPDEQLPDTGIGPDWERTLSPVFITSSIYGTRCSSVIRVDTAGNILFCERTFDPSKNSETRCFEIQAAPI